MGETKVTQASGLLQRCFLEILLFTLLKSSKSVVRRWEKLALCLGKRPFSARPSVHPSGRAVVSVWVLQDSLYCSVIRPTVFVSLNYLCCFDRVNLDP